MIRVILVRHGETAWNKDHRLQGQSAIDIAESGAGQARAAGAYIRAQNPTQGYVTPLLRTHQTFAEFGLAIQPQVLDGLIEQNLGDWEGAPTAQAKSQDAELYAAWKAGTGTPPRGEASELVRKRVLDAFVSIIHAAAHTTPTESPGEKLPLRTAVAVSHGTAIKTLLEELGLIHRSSVISLSAASISVVDMPLHGGLLSSSLPEGGAGTGQSVQEEAEIIAGLSPEQIRSYAKLQMYNLAPAVLSALSEQAPAAVARP